MRASLLVLTVAAAACYNPGVQPCQLACSANRECPDGLACNEQNACAATSTALCDELPIDAPLDGSNATRVTIEVRDRTGGPLAAALVVFADSAGAQVAEIPTGPDGMASVDMLPGGSATVIRTVPRTGGMAGTDVHASTYLDLWPGAHIISQAEIDQRTRTVTFELMPPPNTSMFTVHTSCSGYITSSALSLPVAIPLRCPTFDVIVIAGNPTLPSGSFAAVLPAQTATSIMVPAAAFKPIRNLSGALAGLPTNSSDRSLSLSGWATAALPASTRAFTSTTPTTAGMVGPLVVPADGGLQTQLVVAHQPIAGGPMFQQIVYDRIPAASTVLDRNYNSTLVQWAGGPTFDVTTRRLAWPFYTPVSTTPTSPTFFAAQVTYSHDTNMSSIWRIVGDASRITTTGATQSIMYPDVPGMRNFEPIGADVVSSDTITLFGVEAAAARDVRQLLEPEGSDVGYFKVPALRHMTVSIGN